MSDLDERARSLTRRTFALPCVMAGAAAMICRVTHSDYERARTVIDPVFLCAAGLLIVAERLLAPALKRTIFDSNRYRVLLFRAEYLTGVSEDVYAPLRRLSSFIYSAAFMLAVSAFVNSVAQRAEDDRITAACIALSAGSAALALRSVYEIWNNTAAWFLYEG